VQSSLNTNTYNDYDFNSILNNHNINTSNTSKKGSNSNTPVSTSTATELKLVGRRDDNWYTGKIPSQCPGVGSDGKIYSLPQLSLEKGNVTRESLQSYFDNTWTLTEVIFSSLQKEAAFTRPPYHDLRHPMIFYYGHPAALYINKLRVAGLLKNPINPYFESIFETGVDEMSWDDLSKNKMKWPSVAEVHKYRKQVYETISNMISNLTDEQCSQGIKQDSPLWALAMSFEHERIHLETSSVLIAEMPLEHITFPTNFPAYHPSANEHSVHNPVAGKDYPSNEMIEVPSQKITLGKARDYPSFGWDNEYGRREYEVPTFKASKYLITNGEFLEFVRDGGYSNPDYWTDVGWKFRAFRNVKWPTFWSRKGPQGLHHFDLRLIFDEVPMKWDWPVTVNYHEAEAYTNWKSKQTGKKLRIITELEHNAIRSPQQVAERSSGSNVEDPVLHSNDGRLSNTSGFNLNLSHSSMSPVNSSPANERGFHDVFGNAWQWTKDYFSALPGFEVHPFYEDFSTPCFDGLHHVIQGGSFISTGNEASIYSRFHFRPHFYQHSSFRVVEQEKEDDFITSDSDAPAPWVGNYPFRRSTKGLKDDNEFKASKALRDEHNNELSKSFGNVSNTFGIPMMNGYKNLANLVVDQATKLRIDCASANLIEVGSGVGGLSTILAQSFKSVVGIDHSLDHVAFAKKVWEEKVVKYELQGENGEAVSYEVNVPNTSSQVEFRCSDYTCIPAEMLGFDVVVINDVIDKVSSPNAVLGRLGGVRGLVKQDGLLAVFTSFEWNPQTTPKSLWIDGEEMLAARLASDFTLVSAEKLPMFWNKSQRQVEGKLLSVMLFKKKI